VDLGSGTCRCRTVRTASETPCGYGDALPDHTDPLSSIPRRRRPGGAHSASTVSSSCPTSMRQSTLSSTCRVDVHGSAVGLHDGRGEGERRAARSCRRAWDLARRSRRGRRRAAGRAGGRAGRIAPRTRRLPGRLSTNTEALRQSASTTRAAAITAVARRSGTDACPASPRTTRRNCAVPSRRFRADTRAGGVLEEETPPSLIGRSQRMRSGGVFPSSERRPRCPLPRRPCTRTSTEPANGAPARRDAATARHEPTRFLMVNRAAAHT